MAVATASLITVDEYQAFLGSTESLSGPERTQFVRHINWASAQVEDLTGGRTFISGSLETDIWVGQGWSDIYDNMHSLQTLSQAPIVGNPILYEEASTGTWDTIDTDLYTHDATEGTLYFHSLNGYYFTRGRRYKGVYDYGYSGSASVPYPIKRATSILARLSEIEIDTIGMATTASADGKSRSYDLSIPASVTSLLSPYVR